MGSAFRFILIAFMCIYGRVVFCAQEPQPHAIDSLQQIITETTIDTLRADAMLAMADILRKKDPQKIISLALEAIRIAKETDSKRLLFRGYRTLAQYNYDQGDYMQAIKNYQATYQIAKSLNDDKLVIACENGLATAYRMLGRYEESVNHSFEAIRYAMKAQDTIGSISAYNNIAIVQFYQNERQQSLEYFKKALNLSKQTGKKDLVAKQLNNIGVIYKNLGKIDRALEYYFLELNTWKKLNDKHGLAVTYHNIGSLFLKKEAYEKAIEYNIKSLRLREEIQDQRGRSETYLGMAEIYLAMQSYDKAMEACDSALHISRAIGYKQNEMTVLKIISSIYEEKGKFKLAMGYLKRSHQLEDSLNNLQNKQAIARMKANLESAMKDNKINRLEQEKVLQQEKIRHSEAQRNMLILVILMLVIIGVLLLKSYRQKQKANELLTIQNIEIEEKNQRITDSIVYASRIQKAIIPSIKSMEDHLGNAFVLYMPKDIVSGDFYWFPRELDHGRKKKQKELLFAVADCTGHGVPGAMMSVIGSTGLNRCMLEFGLNTPGAILDRLSQLVEESLAISGSEVSDGMDIALCRLLFNQPGNSVVLEYSGANNPVWIINPNRKQWPAHVVRFGDQNQGAEIKPDKQPIGGFLGRKPFTNNKIELQTGDTIYIFSDGLADQFGGPHGKKFKLSKLKELLVSVYELPMKKQKEAIEKRYMQWKNWADKGIAQRSLEQVDDICMVGLRI